MKNIIVNHEKDMYCGWPANGAVWCWGDEILVCYTKGHYKYNSESHSIDREKPSVRMLSRSKDGGMTWSAEINSEINEIPDVQPVPEDGIDFKAPGFALLVLGAKGDGSNDNVFMVSYDRGKSWQGPYPLPKAPGQITARTDYMIKSSGECFMFLSHEVSGIECTIYSDRAYAVRTNDSARTWKMLGYITDDDVRSVMPSTVEVSRDHFVTAIRRRKDKVLISSEEVEKILAAGKKIPTYQYNWIEIRRSVDGGRGWEFLSKAAKTSPEGEKGHNGNPPALVKLPDGRLVLAYGYRGDDPGIKARISSDGGRTWGDEIVLRDDPLSDDIGYPRMIVRPDGMLVTIYYINTKDLMEQHIEATIWKP